MNMNTETVSRAEYLGLEVEIERLHTTNASLTDQLASVTAERDKALVQLAIKERANTRLSALHANAVKHWRARLMIAHQNNGHSEEVAAEKTERAINKYERFALIEVDSGLSPPAPATPPRDSETEQQIAVIGDVHAEEPCEGYCLFAEKEEFGLWSETPRGKAILAALGATWGERCRPLDEARCHAALAFWSDAYTMGVADAKNGCHDDEPPSPAPPPAPEAPADSQAGNATDEGGSEEPMWVRWMRERGGKYLAAHGATSPPADVPADATVCPVAVEWRAEYDDGCGCVRANGKRITSPLPEHHGLQFARDLRSALPALTAILAGPRDDALRALVNGWPEGKVNLFWDGERGHWFAKHPVNTGPVAIGSVRELSAYHADHVIHAAAITNPATIAVIQAVCGQGQPEGKNL